MRKRAGRTRSAALQDALRVQAGVVGNLDTNRTQMSALVTSSQSATGALQATQAGNQLLALQAQQLADLTAAVAAQGRAQSLQAAQTAAAQDQGREQLRRFLTPGAGYQPTAVHDVPLMMPSITLATAARVGAMAFVVAAIAAAAVHFREGDRRPRGPFLVADCRRAEDDPLRAELKRCQLLGEAGAHDDICLPRLGGEPPTLPSG